jgi:hypothetical protein
MEKEKEKIIVKKRVKEIKKNKNKIGKERLLQTQWKR